MIQEISPKKYHVEYDIRFPKQDGRCFIFRGRDILERLQDGKLVLPTYGELQKEIGETLYLFSIDQEEYYLTSLVDSRDPSPGLWLVEPAGEPRQEGPGRTLCRDNGLSPLCLVPGQPLLRPLREKTQPDTVERMPAAPTAAT